MLNGIKNLPSSEGLNNHLSFLNNEESNIKEVSCFHLTNKMKKGELGQKRLLNLILLVFLAIIIYFIFRSSGFSIDKVTSIIESTGVFGPVILVLVLIIHGIFSFFPMAVLLFFSGTAYGILNASIYSMIGLLLGAVVAFFIGRKYGEGLEKRWISAEKRRHISNLFEKHGILISFFGRMSFFLPSDTVSIASGTTKMNFWKYLWATFLGFLPLVLLFTYVGSKALIIVESVKGIFIVLGVMMVLFLIARYWHNIIDYFKK
ncbi:MAG: TVP38/TMEM64 family protein [archaeon]|nr:TVP38/TMEM64 family protein [archaeon]MCR4323708.1 TVP38/TMEM64 family protein [Nanoarchaeota archaeon]